MSWSVEICGTKEKLLSGAIAEKFDQNKCGENYPNEQKIKDAARDIAKTAAEGSKDGSALRIKASGSASTEYGGEDGKTPRETSQNVKIEIETIYGFVS